VLLPNRAVATSPTICFGTLTPGVKFVARSPSGNGKVRVQIRTRGLLGLLSVIDGGKIQLGKDWAPTPVMGTLGSQLSMLLNSKSIQIVFTAEGDVQFDDIYVDPFLQK
jgi:hypothetical protein